MKDGLINDHIGGIQEDKSGNIYFDTQEGVSKFDGQTFRTLPVNNASGNEWKSEPDDLWFKGNWNKNGVYRYDGKNLYLLAFPKNELEEEYYTQFPNTPWSPFGIYTIFKDSKGNIWFGTSNFGIYRFDPHLLHTNTNVKYPDKQTPLRWMYEDHLTNIPGGGSFGIRSIFEDNEGKFWFCNTTYRYTIDTEMNAKNDHLSYRKEPGMENLKMKEGKDQIYFMSMTEDNEHDLWMLTYEQGVWHYDGTNTTQYIVKDGSKEITLFSIY